MYVGVVGVGVGDGAWRCRVGGGWGFRDGGNGDAKSFERYPTVFDTSDITLSLLRSLTRGESWLLTYASRCHLHRRRHGSGNRCRDRHDERYGRCGRGFGRPYCRRLAIFAAFFKASSRYLRGVSP